MKFRLQMELIGQLHSLSLCKLPLVRTVYDPEEQGVAELVWTGRENLCICRESNPVSSAV